MVTLEELFPFDTGLGYLGILIVSFVASLVPFIPIPYFPLLITASFNRATYRQRVTHFTEELAFLSEDDKDWVMGRALSERLGWP